jgi:hypothetical protein
MNQLQRAVWTKIALNDLNAEEKEKEEKEEKEIKVCM